MKGIITKSVLVGLFLFGISGCYTILQYSQDDGESVYIEQPILIRPIIGPPIHNPVQPPDPPYIGGPHPFPNPQIQNPQPIIRQPETPSNDQGYRDQVRDPLRGQGNREDNERKTRGRS